MILTAFTLFHVVISLVGIGSGLVVVYGWLTGKRFDGLTQLFLWTTVATSVTGFMFPFRGITPGIVVGLISLVVLAIAIYALRARRLAGAWGRTYIVTSILALYFNVFVLVVQTFEKTPALRELAPTQSEPPFQIAQLVVLLIFIGLGFLATKRFRHSLFGGV
jgi:hypothetical protein